MRKYIAALSITAFIAACGGSSDKNTEDSKSASTEDITKNPDYQKGLKLIAGSDCFTCHQVEQKIQGPNYREVANKYAGQSDAVTYLSEKIIKGGNGVWGETFMTPHPGLSQQDAEAMVKYILLLKK